MRMSFRDRFFTPKVARAIVSPSAIVATGAGAALGILVASGWGIPVAAIGLAVAALAVRVGVAIPRDARPDRIDPFTIDEPWRRLVQDALAARRQFADAVGRTLPGPIRDRLTTIGERIEDNVSEAWATARAGHALSDAYKRVDVAGAQQELDAVRSGNAGSAASAATIEALEAQLATARRMSDTISTTHDTLRLLNARLDEAVTRCIELSVGAFRPDQFAQVEGDLGSITGELESLRQAIDVTADAERHGVGSVTSEGLSGQGLSGGSTG